MTLKIKLFSSSQNNLSSLENEVNSWLSVNSDFNVKDIKVTISEHNILMTIMYETLGRASSHASQSLPKMNDNQVVVSPPKPSFQETLNAFAQEDTPRIIIKTDPTPQNIASALDDISPTNVKPGRLIQNNYNKYKKSNQNLTEDQAFNWD